MIRKIYLDMDGVLADFHGRYVDLFGKTPKDARDQKEFSPHWKQFCKTEQFKTLDLWPGAETLLTYVASLNIPVEILTSSGGAKFHESVAAQKVHWLVSRNIPYFANVVSSRKLKANYANSETILVDDTEDVIDAFNAAGGHGILHLNVDATIESIAKLIA